MFKFCLLKKEPVLMGTSNYPSHYESKLALKISTLEETAKVNEFWEQVHEQQKQQHNDEVQKLIFELSLVNMKNNFLLQSNTIILHHQIEELSQIILQQNLEM
eukprot:TRINITY_DN2925_c0_g3_i1.p1 TRINITY_DN2925_c0_g3~~TRINITY_DN2925_c0_g3_i1.p1  ORF type:complete len:103 (+),score=10.68 TRINITY_DN2925_c0_g3_i1:89-397(+)